jgi:predicted  nucleic acid-binding Zn-ribbon protein
MIVNVLKSWRCVSLFSHQNPFKKMPLHEEIARPQAEAVNQGCLELLKDVRRIQQELDHLRSENSRMLEVATVGQFVNTAGHDLTIIGGSWIESYCILQIVGLKSRIAQLKVGASDGDQMGDIPSELQTERDDLRRQKAQLRATRAQILDELRATESETRKEKEDLREYIRLNK